MDQEEQLFINQINRKQINAFRCLFEDIFPSLVYFAYRYVERKEVAEDIVQEVMAGVWENPRSYPSYNSLKTFLYTSVRNSCIDYCRHRQVERRYLSHFSVYEEPDEFDLKIMQEELYHTLLAVVEELPPRCKEIFKLQLAGLKNEEIADRLNLSVETVKTQKKRALAYLRKRLNGTFFLLLSFGLI